MRFVVCIDTESDDIREAYLEMERALRDTGLAWQTSDEAFIGGTIVLPELLNARICEALAEIEQERANTPIDTGQYVCPKCKSWEDGFTVSAVEHSLGEAYIDNEGGCEDFDDDSCSLSWEATDRMRCESCQHEATVADFSVAVDSQ